MGNAVSVYRNYDFLCIGFNIHADINVFSVICPCDYIIAFRVRIFDNASAASCKKFGILIPDTQHRLVMCQRLIVRTRFRLCPVKIISVRLIRIVVVPGQSDLFAIINDRLPFRRDLQRRRNQGCAFFIRDCRHTVQRLLESDFIMAA